MTTIIPAIIPEDFEDLEDKISIVNGRVAIVHVDVLDGTMTPGRAWPYSGDISHFLKISDEVEGFPFWEDVAFEAHLMINNPLELVEDWVRAGAERIIVHVEVEEDEHKLTEMLNELRRKYGKANSFVGVEIGLATTLTTPLERLLGHILEVDFVQLMSVDTLGMQGQKFNESVFDRIAAVKKAFPDTIISVDGGVTVDHLQRLVEVGVERVVVGSAIFRAEDQESALFDFLDAVES